jgi:hypothetical protein
MNRRWCSFGAEPYRKNLALIGEAVKAAELSASTTRDRSLGDQDRAAPHAPAQIPRFSREEFRDGGSDCRNLLVWLQFDRDGFRCRQRRGFIERSPEFVVAFALRALTWRELAWLRLGGEVRQTDGLHVEVSVFRQASLLVQA